MKVLCVGVGAVGGSVAARLERAGVHPVVTDIDPEHVLRLRRPGLELTEPQGRRRIRLDAHLATELSADTVAEADLVLLAVRSQATAAALEPLVPHLRADADVVSLQNGINEDVVASAVSPGRTIGCVVGIGATWIGPGRVELTAPGDLIVGRLHGGRDARLEAARDLLGRAFPTKVSDNILGELWGKMLVNSMTVLGALGGMLTGDLLLTRERRRVVADIVAEGVAVAMAEEVRLPLVFGVVDPALAVERDGRYYAAMDRALMRVGQVFGAVKSVTWRDFELGRATEIDAVTGEIVRRGHRAGVATPLSARVYSMLREIEAGDRKPDVANLELLVAGVKGGSTPGHGVRTPWS